MDSTYASAVAIARRILNCEVARLASRDGARDGGTPERTSHAARPTAISVS
jgi:hypothetical protein